MDIVVDVIIIAVIAALCVFAVISIVKKATQGCCGGSSDKEQVITKDKSGNYRFRYVIDISGMSCDKCAARIANAFNRRDGFYAEVSLKDNKAVVLTEQPASELILRKTICDLGYSAGSITKNENRTPS